MAADILKVELTHREVTLVRRALRAADSEGWFISADDLLLGGGRWLGIPKEMGRGISPEELTSLDAKLAAGSREN